MLLSTCNRTEVYAHATLFHPAMQDVRDFLADYSGVDPDEFADHLYTYYDDAAVAHLFGVAAGLDSMIIGEGEILGQVREAWHVAEREGGERPAAVAHVPPRGRGRQAGPHRDRHRPPRGVGVVGRGRASPPSGSARSTTAACSCSAPARWARAWRSRSPARASREIVVANRTLERAPRSSPRASAAGPIPLDDDRRRARRRATCCSRRPARRTCSSSAATIETVMARRDGRALLVVDIGVPRDIDPGVGEVFGVTLLDIDDLRAFGEQSLAQRRQEIGKVREIIADELDRHRVERAAREVAPLVTALRDRGRRACAPASSSGHRAKLDALDPDARDAGRGAHRRASSTSCCTSRPCG